MKPNLFKFISTFVVILFIGCFPSQAQNPGNDPLTSDISLKSKRNEEPKRPNSPDYDTQFITASYSAGVITLTFAEGEGMCRGSVCDPVSGRIQLFTIDSDEFIVEIEVGILTDYSIELTTSRGNTYYGATY